MGEKTVRPGRYSLTSLLIAEFRAQHAIQKFAVVAIARKNMASKDSKALVVAETTSLII
jgi:hypothetical protein